MSSLPECDLEKLSYREPLPASPRASLIRPAYLSDPGTCTAIPLDTGSAYAWLGLARDPKRKAVYVQHKNSGFLDGKIS